MAFTGATAAARVTIEPLLLLLLALCAASDTTQPAVGHVMHTWQHQHHQRKLSFEGPRHSATVVAAIAAAAAAAAAVAAAAA
eukprot:5870-Heterococcus_DN1.PRE.1